MTLSPETLNNDGNLTVGEDEVCLSRLSPLSPDTNETTGSSAGNVLAGICGVVWDGFNCWGPTNAGSTVYLPCPASKGMDTTREHGWISKENVGMFPWKHERSILYQQSYRTCGMTGQWLNRDGVPDEKGWTNYTPCFTPEILALIKRLYSGSANEAMLKIEIARSTRILEIFGLTLSLTALLLSLFVFYYFRSLRNPRTRLHRHLFVAMVIQVAVRLTLYIDQFIVRSNSLSEKTVGEQQQYAKGIDNTPFLCEAAYICLEYARTSMFMWMFVEGLYLHNMITVTVFEEKLSPSIYPLVGWVFPIPLTLSWAIVTATHYGSATCWWGYNFTLYYWIIEGPRLGVLIVNLTFLLNILRVLVTKLRQSNSSEAHQARKAVKAALVLLPLLGLTNLVTMLDAPLERSAVVFGIWSYTTHALTSCQGFIVACLYCFWNGEVQMALKKFVRYKILNGGKHGGRKTRGRGSVRMSLINNSGVGTGGNVTLLGSQPMLHGNASKSLNNSPSLPAQLIRLSPIANSHRNNNKRVNNKDIELQEKQNNSYFNQKNLNVHLEEDEEEETVVVEKAELVDNSSSKRTNCLHSHSKQTISRTNISGGLGLGHSHGHPASNVRRLSKLKIWISPVVLVKDKNRRRSRCKNTANSSTGCNGTSENISSVRYVQEMEVSDVQIQRVDNEDGDQDNLGENGDEVTSCSRHSSYSRSLSKDGKTRAGGEDERGDAAQDEEKGNDQDEEEEEDEDDDYDEEISFNGTPTTSGCHFHIEMLQDLQVT